MYLFSTGTILTLFVLPDNILRIKSAVRTTYPIHVRGHKARADLITVRIYPHINP